MKVFITGGAGFIGINAAKHFLERGDDVVIYDNFSRKGGKNNVAWLQSIVSTSPAVVEGDIRADKKVLQRYLRDVDVVLHLAGQVAVTTSVENPQDDFENNAAGCFNLLEAVRLSGRNPIFIYSSTNKVYGGLEDVKVVEKKTRYSFADLPHGVPERQPLDFHSPYGCSKGASDQYVRDYHRIYGLNTIVFRQSCIYGPRQFGIEDQGWLAWFIIALSKNKKIKIYGNGKQVRDILYIDDLMAAYQSAIDSVKKTSGQIYNIGGGAGNTISVWHEFRPILEKVFGRSIDASFFETRPGDQPIYISDIRKAKKDFGWKPTIGTDEGIKRLYEWVVANKQIFVSE